MRPLSDDLRASVVAAVGASKSAGRLQRGLGFWRSRFAFSFELNGIASAAAMDGPPPVKQSNTEAPRSSRNKL